MFHFKGLETQEDVFSLGLFQLMPWWCSGWARDALWAGEVETSQTSSRHSYAIQNQLLPSPWLLGVLPCILWVCSGYQPLHPFRGFCTCGCS